MTVVTLVYSGWRTRQVTDGTLQHLPRALNQPQGSRHPASISLASFTFLNFVKIFHRLRQISSQSSGHLIGCPRVQPLYANVQKSEVIELKCHPEEEEVYLLC